jgi:Uri superfamily endonuclease
MTKGTYCLVMRLKEDKAIPIGKRPPVRFPEGFYCYVGSAMNSLEKRICRHKSQSKKLHWHIDWFLEHAELVDVKSIESKERLECSLSHDVACLSDGVPTCAREGMRGFGSSDCRACSAHLHYFNEDPSQRLDRLVKKWKSSSRNTGRRASR